MGTPEFAVASLEAIAAAGHTVCGVFSQPDRPVGRHQGKLQPTPVKAAAQALGLPVYQPAKLRDGTALALIEELDPELYEIMAPSADVLKKCENYVVLPQETRDLYNDLWIQLGL